MFPFVWRGRLAPAPRSDELSASASFIDFARRHTERMCGRPQHLISQAQEAGVEMYGTFCLTCPLRSDCAYLDQIDTIQRFEGRRIVIAAHEVAFLPMPFASDLVIVDEDLATKAARALEIDPARLLDPEKWRDKPELEATARVVAGALERHGEELTALREPGLMSPP
jgi:hypothetical protein